MTTAHKFAARLILSRLHGQHTLCTTVATCQRIKIHILFITKIDTHFMSSSRLAFSTVVEICFSVDGFESITTRLNIQW